MTGQSKVEIRTIFFAAAISVTGTNVGHAQEEADAASAILSLGTLVEANTNYYLDVTSAGVTYVGQETLDFNLSTETRAQKLEFSANGAVQGLVAPSGVTSYSFADPHVLLGYSREAAASRFEIEGDFRTSEVISIFDADPGEPLFLVVDQGTLATSNATIGLGIRQNAPLGLNFGVSYGGRDYQDTTNPALYDTDKLTYTIGASLHLNDAMQADLSLSQESFQADTAPTATETETTNLTIALSTETKADLTLNTKVGMRRRDTLSGSLSTVDGYSASVGATQGTKTGSVFGTISHDATTPTTRTTLEFGTVVERKTSNLTASLAANVDGTGRQTFLGNLGYGIAYPVGSFEFDLGQEIKVSDLDQELLSTTIGMIFRREVNSTSTILVDLNLGRSEEAGSGAAVTQTRGTVSAAYARQLTPDWNLNMGYAYEFYQEEAQPSRSSDSVFLTLTRDIDFGF